MDAFAPWQSRQLVVKIGSTSAQAKVVVFGGGATLNGVSDSSKRTLPAWSVAVTRILYAMDALTGGGVESGTSGVHCTDCGPLGRPEPMVSTFTQLPVESCW